MISNLKRVWTPELAIAIIALGVVLDVAFPVLFILSALMLVAGGVLLGLMPR